ncbi:MAG: hypothetical protein K2K46_14635 [Lachnospiraceae bacterium]|nr:hypothetical protein [Lachnospiraceae bacterium]
MRKKKNRFFLFCCSFIPGAGELYLGFMNMGLSLLMSFALLTVIVGFTGIGVLAFMPMVLWVYSFFHANNLGSLTDEQFYSMEDTYLFGFSNTDMESIRKSLYGRYRKALAIILIILGLSMLWNVAIDGICMTVGYDFYERYILPYSRVIENTLPQLVISIIIIWFGIRLISGKKVELDILDEKNEEMGMKNQSMEPKEGQVNGKNDDKWAGNTDRREW